MRKATKQSNSFCVGTCYNGCCLGFSSNAVSSQLLFMCPLGLVNIPRYSQLLTQRPFPKHPHLNRGGSPEHFKQSGDFNEKAAHLYGPLHLLIIAAPINAPMFIRPPPLETCPLLIKDQRRTSRLSPCCQGTGRLCFWRCGLQTSLSLCPDVRAAVGGKPYI